MKTATRTVQYVQYSSAVTVKSTPNCNSQPHPSLFRMPTAAPLTLDPWCTECQRRCGNSGPRPTLASAPQPKTVLYVVPHEKRLIKPARSTSTVWVVLMYFTVKCIRFPRCMIKSIKRRLPVRNIHISIHQYPVRSYDNISLLVNTGYLWTVLWSSQYVNASYICEQTGIRQQAPGMWLSGSR